MAKHVLKYDASWSSNDRDNLEATLELSEKQVSRLFEQKLAIQLSDEQFAALSTMGDDDTDTDTTDTNNATTHDDRNVDDVDGVDDADKQDADIDLTDVSIVSERDRDAVTVGEKLSKETNTLFALGYEARERVNVTPLLLRAAFIADEGNETVATWPVPGSVRKGGKVMSGTGKDAVEIIFGENEKPVWDKFKYNDVNLETGNQVQKNGSFFKSMIRSTAEGKRLIAEYDALTTAINSYKKDGPECPAKYKTLTRPQCVRRRKLAASRLGYMETATRTAVKLDKQCRAIDDLALVGYRFETEKVDGKEQYVNRNEPVQVFAINWTETKNKTGGIDRIKSEGEPSNMSIGAFTRFDVQAAIAKAKGKDKVTLAHLQDTVKRDTEGKRGAKADASSKDDWSKHIVENIRQFENILSGLGLYLNPDDKDQASKIQTAITKRMTEKDGDEFVVLLGNVSIALDEAYKVVANRYDAIMAEKAKERTAKAA